MTETTLSGGELRRGVDLVVLRAGGLGVVALAAVTPVVGLRVGGVALALWVFVVAVLGWLRSTEGDTGRLGAATGVTLARGWLVCLLAGFIGHPPREGALAWAPAAVYTGAALLDLVDGYVARKRGEVSAVGGRLDVAIDALGLMVAPLVAIRQGRLGVWYLAVGAAYYLFHAGLWLRRRRGLPTHLERVRPSRHTRLMAGCQMGVVATALFPVLGPPATSLAATVFMVPNLVLFGRDWLIASGRLDPNDLRYRRFGGLLASAAAPLPPALRGAAAIGLVTLALQEGPAPGLMVVLAGTLLAGVLTRLSAFAAGVALSVRLAQEVAANPSGIGQALTLFTFVAVSILMLTGGGRPAVWSPEDRLLLRRAGERPAAES